jgi:phage shock protein PspC (stress-responsive transcriptional regulator)
MFAGVCSGLADYFAIDPIVVRLVFVLVAFAGGASVLAYIILWIVMPAAEGGSSYAVPNIGNRGALVAGATLVILGILFLLGNTGIFWWWNWSLFWPVLLVGLGVLILSRRLGGR